MDGCCGGYNYGWQGGAYPSYGGYSGANVFVLIVVLFILLIIIGAVII